MTTPDSIDITGISKPALLAALYNASKQQGMGFMHERGYHPMTEEQASVELERTTSFDYLHGRVMKISVDGDSMYARLYDRDNGQGAAARVVAALRAEMATA